MNSLGDSGRHHRPENYPIGHHPFPVEKNKSSLFRGCLITLFAGSILCSIILFAILVGILYKTFSGPSRILSSLKDDRANITEKIITEGESEKKIVVISINGIIYSGNNLTREHSSSDILIQQIRKAQEDSNVVAVILDMNTPGGSVTATDEVHHELLKIRKDKKKVLTSMRSVAASGGYYLAAGTDYVFANRLTLTGSIGVIIGGVNYAGLFESLGIKSEVYKSGKLKDILNMARPRKPYETQIIQDLVDETHMEFAKIVVDGRNLELKQVLTGPIGDAGIFSGRKAKELGLVDELGYLEDAIEKAKEMARVKDPSVILYTPHYSITDFFFASLADILIEVLPGYPSIIKKGQPYYLCPIAL